MPRLSILGPPYRVVTAGLMLASWYAVCAQQVPDPRGPIVHGLAIRITKEGVQADSPPAKAPGTIGAWNPHWIWLHAESNPDRKPASADFRRELTLGDSLPTDALAYISADKRYRLWVNGMLASRGPDDPGFDEILSENWSHQWLYDTVDLKPYLRPGVNVIAAEVLGSGRLPGYSLHRPGFAFRLRLDGSSGQEVLESDTTWSASAVNAYGEGEMPLPEGAAPDRKPEVGLTYDARLEDPLWRAANFRAKWKPASIVPSIWGTLLPSQLPARMEAAYPIQAITRLSSSAHVQPGIMGDARVHLDGAGSFSVDYDRVLSAYASFRVRGPAGTVVTIEPAETKTHSNPRRSAQVILRDGTTYFEHPAYDAFSTTRITVTHASGPVDFEDVRAVFVSDPVQYRGSFASSDPQLNHLWNASRWLTQICMQDHYLDSPNHQEPIGDFGDYLIEAIENDYAFNQQAITQQDLRKFGEILDHSGSVNFHTSYALLWLQMLVDYYQYTGDKALPLAEKPTVDRLLAHFSTFRGANGLLSEAPNYMFMDWVTIGGFPAHHPPAVIGQGYLTAFYYRALQDGMKLAALAGDTAMQRRYSEERTQIAAAFERELWDSQAGLYRDGKPYQNHQPIGRWLPEDKEIETHSVHVNALAVLYDLAPRERQAAILNHLNEAGPLNVQPYFMHFVFAAEVHAGVFDRWAPSQLKRWSINPETQTYKEMFGGGDYSHGWGGTPLIQMSAHILGVSPAAPGYTSVMLAPHLAGLAAARGTVPTPKGDVEVSWRYGNGVFTLDATSPPGVPIVFDPQTVTTKTQDIQIDGVPAQVATETVRLSGGKHRLVIQ